MFYKDQIQLTSDVWNNALSYHERFSQFGKAEIMLPSIKSIDSLEDITLSKAICLEEINESWILQSCTWLEHIYEFDHQGKNIILVDNHNHVLYFRMKFVKDTLDSTQTSQISLRHIDQHSDLNTPDPLPNKNKLYDLEYIWEYTNYSCQISSFITPFFERYPETEFTRIKSEHQLLKTHVTPTTILDIDLDFWAPEMNIEKHHKTITLTRQLIQEAELITIATSPMFMNQKYSLDILHQLLT